MDFLAKASQGLDIVDAIKSGDAAEITSSITDTASAFVPDAELANQIQSTGNSLGAGINAGITGDYGNVISNSSNIASQYVAPEM